MRPVELPGLCPVRPLRLPRLPAEMDEEDEARDEGDEAHDEEEDPAVPATKTQSVLRIDIDLLPLQYNAVCQI